MKKGTRRGAPAKEPLGEETDQLIGGIDHNIKALQIPELITKTEQLLAEMVDRLELEPTEEDDYLPHPTRHTAITPGLPWEEVNLPNNE